MLDSGADPGAFRACSACNHEKSGCFKATRQRKNSIAENISGIIAIWPCGQGWRVIIQPIGMLVQRYLVFLQPVATFAHRFFLMSFILMATV
jgi:hypothetical protein